MKHIKKRNDFIKEEFINKYGEEMFCPRCGSEDIFEDKPLKSGVDFYICNDCANGWTLDPYGEK